MSSIKRIQEVFSVREVKHGLGLFSARELEAAERLMTRRDGKLFIHCQIKDKYKSAKPEEIIRQIFLHQLLHEYINASII